MIQITDKPIEIGAVLQSVFSGKAGAIVPFIGTVRDDEGIPGLFYETYDTMAESEMEKIAGESRQRWPVEIAVVHRTGWVPAGSAAVVIAAAAAHRKEAFEACRYVIEEIKKRVPVWKRRS